MSSTFVWMYRTTGKSSALAKNGTRQPQLRNASLEMVAVATRKTRLPRHYTERNTHLTESA